MSRGRLAELAALAVTTAGLLLLAQALADATPPHFFGTEEEVGMRSAGQELVVVAGAVSAVAAGLLAARRRPWAAVLVLAPGLLCPALVHLFPQSLLAWVAFLVLGPAALVGALAAALSDGSPAPR